MSIPPTRGSVSLLVKRDGRILVLDASAIDWIEAVGDYVRLYVGSSSHLLRSTLAEMERRLVPEGFARIHRSRLVNRARIREFAVEGEQTSAVVLNDGQRLNASQSCLKLLQRV